MVEFSLNSVEYSTKLNKSFDCVPHDFIEWYPDEKTTNPEKRALKILIPKEQKTRSLRKLSFVLPLDKLEELGKKAEDMQKEPELKTEETK